MKKNKKRFPGERASWAAIEFTKEPDQKFQHSFVIFLAVLTVCGFSYASIAKVSMSVEARGRLISKNPPVPIRSAQKMSVDKVLVAENQHVKKEQLLVTSREAVDRANLQRIQAYLKVMSSILARASGPCIGCKKDLAAQENLYRSIQIQGDLITALSTVEDNARELSLALDERAALPKTTSDLTLQITLAKRKVDLIISKKAQTILAKEYETLTESIATNQTKILEKNQKTAERINSSVARLKITTSDVQNKMQYLNTQYSIRAPFDGVVVALNLKGSGEVLQVGQELMSLIPANDPLIAELEVRNRDIAEVREGQLADIKVDSMPEFEYGSLRGKLVEIRRRERDPASDATDISGSKFVVRADLSQQHLTRNHQHAPLLNGMTIRADIISREESLLHVVTKALFALKDDFKAENER